MAQPGSCSPAPFPFIVGRGRSGTTLLRAMLASHPDLSIPPESHFIAGFAKNRRRYEGRSGFARTRYLQDLGDHWGFKRWELPLESVGRTIEDADDLPSALRGTFLAYARNAGKVRYGDKTPINVLHIDRLSRLFPEARVLHVIRDGRNVALSYLDVPFGPNTMEEAAVYWRRFVRKGRRAGESLGSDRYVEVRYEDLVSDTDNVLQAVCPFLELDYQEMLRYWQRTEWSEIGLEHHRNLGRPPSPNLRDWRTEMPNRQVHLFEAIAGDLLSELGYELSGGSAGRRRRRAAIGAHLTVQRRRLRRGVSRDGWYRPISKPGAMRTDVR
jgi:hypothetical protein